MAFTQADVTSIETAIMEIIAGTRVVRCSIGDKSFEFSAPDLPQMRAMRAEIKAEVSLADGSFSPRTYAKQGGRAT